MVKERLPDKPITPEEKESFRRRPPPIEIIDAQRPMVVSNIEPLRPLALQASFSQIHARLPRLFVLHTLAMCASQMDLETLVPFLALIQAFWPTCRRRISHFALLSRGALAEIFRRHQSVFLSDDLMSSYIK
jgi:hypothetical protein